MKVTIKTNKTQLNYLYWVFSYYANSTQDFDPQYKDFSLDMLDEIERLLKLKRKVKPLALSRVSTPLFNDLIQSYYAGIAHDRKLVWERNYLLDLQEATKIV